MDAFPQQRSAFVLDNSAGYTPGENCACVSEQACARSRDEMRGRRRVGLARSSFDQFRAWLRLVLDEKCDRRRAKCGVSSCFVARAYAFHVRFRTRVYTRSDIRVPCRRTCRSSAALSDRNAKPFRLVRALSHTTATFAQTTPEPTWAARQGLATPHVLQAQRFERLFEPCRLGHALGAS